jgi:hypothetical protein
VPDPTSAIVFALLPSLSIGGVLQSGNSSFNRNAQELCVVAHVSLSGHARPVLDYFVSSFWHVHFEGRRLLTMMTKELLSLV